MIINLDLNQCVTKNVLKILEDKLTPMETEEIKNTFCLEQDLLQCDIEWRQLELKLNSMQRQDLIEEIQNTTAITNGKIKYILRKKKPCLSETFI